MKITSILAASAFALMSTVAMAQTSTGTTGASAATSTPKGYESGMKGDGTSNASGKGPATGAGEGSGNATATGGTPGGNPSKN